ncbi:MAG: sensor histidine kinase, partial [Planctomycetota bacterium]
MFDRRSLRAPITLGVTLIVLVLALTTGWIVTIAIGLASSDSNAPLFAVMLPIGITLFVVVLLGVIAYLTISIKAVNLNRRQQNFIDSVTHELKSPIASLKLYLQTLSRRSVDETERA